jgi:hypothetical protein
LACCPFRECGPHTTGNVKIASFESKAQKEQHDDEANGGNYIINFVIVSFLTTS